MKYLMVVVAASVIFLAGCKVLPVQPENDKRSASAALPKAEKPALLYIYREANGMTESYPRTISVDGRTLGQLVGNAYYMLKVSPGPHVISSPGTNVSVVSVNAESGGTYYFSQEVIPSIKLPLILLNKVDEATGKRGVAKGVMLTAQQEDTLFSSQPKPVTEKSAAERPTVNKSAFDIKSSTDNDSPTVRLRELKRLLKERLITEQEYAEKKKRILELM